MTWMDRWRRRAGLTWVVGGVAFQVGCLLVRGVAPGLITVILCTAVMALAAAVAIGSHRSVQVLSWVIAAMLALDFTGAVADRFGAFGSPGSPGVSWGSWPAFVAYTGHLLPGLPAPAVAAAAVSATVAEIALAALLLTGWQRRWVGKAVAGLLLTYLVGMAVGLGADAVATYAVPVLIGGALLVSATPARRPAPRPAAALTLPSVAD